MADTDTEVARRARAKKRLGMYAACGLTTTLLAVALTGMGFGSFTLHWTLMGLGSVVFLSAWELEIELFGPFPWSERTSTERRLVIIEHCALAGLVGTWIFVLLDYGVTLAPAPLAIGLLVILGIAFAERASFRRHPRWNHSRVGFRLAIASVIGVSLGFSFNERGMTGTASAASAVVSAVLSGIWLGAMGAADSLAVGRRRSS